MNPDPSPPSRESPRGPDETGEKESREAHPLADQLARDVQVLAGEIGERNVLFPDALEQASHFIGEELRATGLEVQRQTFHAQGLQGRRVPCHNLEVELPGSRHSERIVVIGAHYDSVAGSPGANDNGSGVAAALALARTFARRSAPPGRTLRFVFFVNEEPPFFQTSEMGSLVYARRSAELGEDIRGMLSLETIGYFDERTGSQSYPLPPLGWFYPSRGNFIAFVSNLRSGRLVRESVRAFRDGVDLPAEAAALPGFIPGVAWSDQWAFWKEGYRAIMVTDTAPYRYPHYHTPEDTPDKLDYERFAEVVEGLEAVVDRLARY